MYNLRYTSTENYVEGVIVEVKVSTVNLTNT